MYAWELIKETLLRKSFVPVIHLVWCCLYCFVAHVTSDQDDVLERIPFIFGGLLLPAILSMGILGNDIASGRIVVLVTKPLPFFELYIWRYCGLVLQGFIHLVIAGVIVLVINRLFGYGSVEQLHVWLIASLLLFSAVAALSTTLSIIAKRNNNLMILVGLLLIVLAFKIHIAPVQSHVTKCVDMIVRYGLPSVELLYRSAARECSFSQRLGTASYVLALTLMYIAVGVLLLTYKEFRRQCD